MSESSIRMQTYIVCGVMIGCFSILYPKIFHPMLLRSLGIIKTGSIEQDNPIPSRTGPYGPDRLKPSIRGAESESPNTSKRGGILSLVLPVYGVGIVIYLFYTLSKLYKSKQRKCDKQKDEYLRHYYRDFHYDVNRGEFRMGRDSSDNDDEQDHDSRAKVGVPPSGRVPFPKKMKPATRKGRFTNQSGQFDWATAYGSDANSDIYRSAKSLPRDLDELLYRMENEEIVDNEELSSLRVRLEQTEREMMRLLHAMDHAEQLIVQSGDEKANKDEDTSFVPFKRDSASQLTDLPTHANSSEPSEADTVTPLTSVGDGVDFTTYHVEQTGDTEYESDYTDPVTTDE